MKSSSLPIITSTSGAMRRFTSTALAGPPCDFQSEARKLRSKETIVPACLAACMASMASSAVVGERAAKMPPQWNQRAPSSRKMRFQSTSPGFICEAAE